VQPRRPELLIVAGKFFLDTDDPASAERVLRTLIEVDPGFGQGYSLLGRALLDQRKLERAKAEFEETAAREPHNVSARIMRAMIADVSGDQADATRRYEEILKLDPSAAVAANNLAWIYSEIGHNLDRALALAQSAVEYLPEEAAVHDTLGWVYYRKGLHRLALTPFQQSVDREPGNAIYLYHLALAQHGSGDNDAARRTLTTVLTLQPDLEDARQLLASLTT
jgi:tetratricopeptide (TPR) repeat protein